jgi:hypothetical protein
MATSRAGGARRGTMATAGLVSWDLELFYEKKTKLVRKFFAGPRFSDGARERARSSHGSLPDPRQPGVLSGGKCVYARCVLASASEATLPSRARDLPRGSGSLNLWHQLFPNRRTPGGGRQAFFICGSS